MNGRNTRRYFKRVQSLLELQLEGIIYSYFYLQQKRIMDTLFGEIEKDLDLEMRINSRIVVLDDLWLIEDDHLVEIVTPTLKRGIASGVKVASRSVGKDLFRGVEDEALAALNKRTVSIKQINPTTQKLIRESLGEGITEHETMRQLQKRVLDITDLSDGRAMLIARTETASAINEGTMAGLKNGDIQQKRWIGGTRPSHAAQNGQVRNINEPFSNGQMYPCDGTMGAKENVNCTCCISGVV